MSATRLFDIIDAARKLPEASLRRLGNGHRRRSQASLDDVTALSDKSDPYRVNDGIAGRWFAEQLKRFSPNKHIHLRGLHYKCMSAGDVMRPDKGRLYANDDWDWFQYTAAKSARWLGYVPFDAIIDERNARPVIYVPEERTKVGWFLSERSVCYEPEVPERPNFKDALPRFTPDLISVCQPYRIVLFGEKTSLEEELRPIAEKYGTELLLPTGEASDTMIAELAARSAEDGRTTVILYCSDFDPSGRQMPVSVSRKLMALKDLYYPNLGLELYHIALTLEQVKKFNLPDSPIKEGENRGKKWQEVFGREQTEIDALLALHPGALSKIVEDFIGAFYDASLGERAAKLARQRVRLEQKRLEHRPGYHKAIKGGEEGAADVRPRDPEIREASSGQSQGSEGGRARP